LPDGNGLFNQEARQRYQTTRLSAAALADIDPTAFSAWPAHYDDVLSTL